MKKSANIFLLRRNQSACPRKHRKGRQPEIGATGLLQNLCVFFCRGANAAPCTPGARACGILYWQVVCVCCGGSTHVSQSFTLCRLFWRQEG